MDTTNSTAPWQRHPAFALPAVPAELAEQATAAGWPEHIVARAVALRIDRGAIEAWLRESYPTPEMLDQWLTGQEALWGSTLVVRTATWSDQDLLVDLYAHSPETVDDWTVTVERSPNPYAGFRLQEHAFVLVLEDQRVGLGAVTHSARNTLVAGIETSVHVITAWRVRDGLRGMGFSNQLLMAPGPGTARFGLITYWYGRSGNSSRAWIDHVVQDLANRPEEWSVTVDGLTATVQYFPTSAMARTDSRVRPVTIDDLPRCVELINGTHRGLDLFRPYTVEFLREHLDDQMWGPKPWFASSVYGWDDYAVIELDGEIVACGGLWDRGESMREHWLSSVDSTSFVVDPTAVMDFGFAEGHDDLMAALVEHFLARSADRGRSGMLAPLEFLPSILDRCRHLNPVPDQRTLEVMPFISPQLKVDLPITRPYTDLAYW